MRRNTSNAPRQGQIQGQGHHRGPGGVTLTFGIRDVRSIEDAHHVLKQLAEQRVGERLVTASRQKAQRRRWSQAGAEARRVDRGDLANAVAAYRARHAEASLNAIARALHRQFGGDSNTITALAKAISRLPR